MIRSFTDTLWGAAEVADLSTARWGDRLLLCHPALPPKELVRNGVSGWQLRDWPYEQSLDDAGQPRELVPVRDASPDPRSRSRSTTARAEIAAGSFVTVVASEPVFTPDHINAVIAVNGASISASSIPTRRPPAGVWRGPAGAGGRQADPRLGGAGVQRGAWLAACVAVHQERLVIGGSRDVPDRLWFSKTGHPFNFDPGTGLDDEAITFRLAGDEQHDIRGLLPGRLLQVFTTSGEWIVRGAPITPGDGRGRAADADRLLAGRRLDPVEVDGAALFIGASGRELREFLYAESEQAYQAADIALLSRHLLDDPIADAVRPPAPLGADRPRATGSWRRSRSTATATSSPGACSHGSGRFRSVAMHDGEPHFLVELGGQVLLERFDERRDDRPRGHARQRAAGHAVERSRAPGGPRGRHPEHAVAAPASVVAAGSVTTSAPTTSVTVGVPYEHTRCSPCRWSCRTAVAPASIAPTVRFGSPSACSRPARCAPTPATEPGCGAAQRRWRRRVLGRGRGACIGLAPRVAKAAMAGRAGRACAMHHPFGHLRDHGEHVMGALNSLATLGLNLALNQQAQQAESKELRQERDRQLQAISLRDAQDQRQQEQSLRRRLAEERARAGGAGVGSSGGSADAILAGLVEESRALDAERRQQSGLRIDDIRRSFDARSRRSLLDFAGRSISLGNRIAGGRSGRSLLD